MKTIEKLNAKNRDMCNTPPVTIGFLGDSVTQGCFAEVAREEGAAVCDCYSKWKRLYEGGVDITNLLANKINHPSEEMTWMLAYSLIETMFQ